MVRFESRFFMFLFFINVSSYLSASVIQNGSFEDGLVGWSINSDRDILVVPQFEGFSPVDGSSFAVLQSGGADIYNTLSQVVSLQAGEVLVGSAFFKTFDYLPFDDDAYVRIVELNAILFSSRVSAVGDFGSTPWTRFSFMAPTTGAYTIEFAVRNSTDSLAISYLGVDDLRAVPEPTSMATLSLASVFLLGRLKRVNKIWTR